MKLSILIPVFNEASTVGNVIEAVEKVAIQGAEIEIVIVNDASTDATKIEIEKYVIKYNNITVFHHDKNQGKGSAVRTGIRYAKGEYVVIQDADLEYNPQDIKKLVAALREDAHVIYGTRLKRRPHLLKEERTGRFLLHYVGNRFLSILTSALYGQWITDMETCYKLFPKKVAEEMLLRAKGFEIEPEITVKLMKRRIHITEIPITATPRGYEEGKKLHTIRDGTKALWTILKYRFIE